MRLKRMEITGFKSFCDRIVIDFPPGVSAIVGPNGCGKSNVVDALRWAMGEQSVKQLRGRSMEDVIFAGTNGRPPLNLAEVSLTLSNEEGDGPEELKDFTEIMMTRRLYRSGESAYLINKQPCRLKDITNIFLGSGMGARSYAVIQQGNIGAITDAGPEERRFFIEEAAGITRYKTRKTEALRKLDATRQNLLRVTDIISEVERQMNGLKRQARKAERYREYQVRIRELDIRLAVHQHNELTREIRKQNGLINGLRDEETAQATRLKQLDAAVADVKLRRSQKGQEITRQKGERFEMQRTIDRTENDLSHLKKTVERLAVETRDLRQSREELTEKNRQMTGEITAQEDRIQQLKTEADAIRKTLASEEGDARTVRDRVTALTRELDAGKTRLMELMSREARFRSASENAAASRENLNRRLRKVDEAAALAERNVTDLTRQVQDAESEAARSRRNLQEAEERIAAIGAALSEKRNALARQVKAAQAAENERNQVRSRQTALKKMAENYEWYRDGVKAVMKRDEGRERILGLMADVLDPEPSLEPAVEAVLGEALQYVLVQDPEVGQSAITFLESGGAGRSGFVPVAAIRPVNGNTPPAPGKRLLDHIGITPGFETVAEALLGHVALTEDLAEALVYCRGNGGARTAVTRNGAVVTGQGIMVGGSADKLSGILTKKQELKTLTRQLAELDQLVETEQAAQKNLEAALRGLENELQQENEVRKQSTADEIEAQKALYKATESLRHARRERDTLRSEQDQLLDEADSVGEKISEADAAVSEAAEEVRTLQASLAKMTEDIQSVTGEARTLEEQVVDRKVRKTALDAELENGIRSLDRLRSFQADTVKRLGEMATDIAEKEKRKTASAADIDRMETALARLYEDLKILDRTLAGNESEYTAIDQQIQENDRSIAEVQEARSSVVEKIREQELEQSQRQMRLENIAERVQERYHRPLTALRTELNRKDAGRPPAELPSPDVMAEELEDLRKKMDRLGEVNMGAIAEYEQLQERYTFLTSQREDLEKAMGDLNSVIRRINKITQERFLETFQMVNEKLQTVFPRLFDGGSAQLVLTEPEKPLETGVEFMVHPPGKRLTRLSLLSGGEKALSAIAFVFSIFLIKPASFCILDEIDAPLDDANVFRFNQLLKLIGEKSQIIMITHKKKSMEFADMLFGVTMEQKGISKVVSVNFDGWEETSQ